MDPATSDEVKRYYSEWWENPKDIRNVVFERLNDYVRQRIPPGHGRRALDVGSGRGRIISYLVEKGHEVTAEESTEDTALVVSETKHVYTASKVAAGRYYHAYQRLYNQDFTILRYGIPCGPRARDGTVIALFLRKALSGEPLTIHSDGSQHRNFIYVEDLAQGNVAALRDIATNRTYNLNGSRPVTIREIADTITKLVGNVHVEYKEARPGDYGGVAVSNDRASDELGWKPRVDFEEGLRRYIEWFRGHRDA